MNSKLSVILAGVLGLAGIVLLIDRTGTDSSDPELSTRTPREGGGPPRRQGRSAEERMSYLKSLPGLDLNSAPSFASIESQVRGLTNDQIHQLLEENTSHEGLSGWLRSALWAELGRRNDRESFEMLLGQLGKEDDGPGAFASDQAVFAFIRGRTESLKEFDETVDDIVDDIGVFAKKTKSHHWMSKAISVFFDKLARMDHELAWDLASGPCFEEGFEGVLAGFHDPGQTAAISGFVGALSSQEQVQSYFEEWEGVLDTPTYRKAYEAYQKQIHSHLSGFIAVPPEERMLSNALASLARFDPEKALAWLKENEMNPEKPDYNRIHGMWRQLATEHPQEALEILAREEYADARRANLSWLLIEDFSLTPDAIAATPEASHQVQILGDVIRSAASNHVKDFMPTPEGPNRLPNFQERYDDILEAIELGTHSDKQKERLQVRLEKEFQGKLNSEE